MGVNSCLYHSDLLCDAVRLSTHHAPCIDACPPFCGGTSANLRALLTSSEQGSNVTASDVAFVLLKDTLASRSLDERAGCSRCFCHHPITPSPDSGSSPSSV